MKNRSIECVVFDLDGTLIKSHKTILLATERAFADIGSQIKIDENEFLKLIGHQFKDIFNRLEFPSVDFKEFITAYKKVYSSFLSESEFYPNLERVLSSLKRDNMMVGLLTTKGQDQAESILEYFGLDKYFNNITGKRSGVEVKPSAEPLLNICSELNVKPEKTLMVGDSEMDIQCAKNAMAKSCGVTFGYRTKELLQKEEPDYLISDLIELLEIIGVKENYD